MEQEQEIYFKHSRPIRLSVLVVGLLLFSAGIIFLYLEIYLRQGLLNSGALLRNSVIIMALSLSATISGLILTIQSLIKTSNELRAYLSSSLNRLASRFVNIIFVFLFVIALVCLLFFLLQPEVLLSAKDEKLIFSAQILITVCISGFLGGYVREIYSRISGNGRDFSNVFYQDFWQILFSLIGSIVLSIVFFLLLRAGILKSESVDSFNLYGVAGISIVTGYLSDRVIGRFTTLYSTLFESDQDKVANTEDENIQQHSI